MSTPTSSQETSPATLPAPCPTQPVAGQPVETDAPVFNWTPIPKVMRYRVQIASTEAFDTIHYDEVKDHGAVISLDSVLPEDSAMVYWRVRAEMEDEEPSAWSNSAHFAIATAEPEGEEGTIRVEAPPVPVHPGSQQETPVDQSAIPFSWESIPEASGYQLQVAPTEDFANPSVDLCFDQTTSVTLYDVLPSGGSFYWRVRPLFRVAGPGPWSSAVSFAIAPPAEPEENLAPEAADPEATARATGPVEQARTSKGLSLTVSLLVVLSFIATIVLIILFS